MTRDGTGNGTSPPQDSLQGREHVELKPLAALTGTLCVLIKVTNAITALAFVRDIYDYYSYASLPPDADPNDTSHLFDIAHVIVELLLFALGIVRGITFLVWIYRTNKNLRTLSGQQMRFAPGWAVGCYFIPIVNFFMPYQAMKEIWQVSHKSRGGTPSIVAGWWALWLTTIVSVRRTPTSI